MKQTLRLALLLLSAALSISTHAQSSRALRAVQKANEAALKSGFDIVLPPLEQVPEQTPLSLKRLAATAAPVTNWGRDLLLPPAVQARLVAECKFPVVVKVTDTAPKWGHQYLQTGQLAGSNYTGEAGTDDVNGHSTHCAGIIGGREVGLAWALVEAGVVKLKPVKVLTNTGSGQFTWVAQAYATELADDKRLLASGTSVVYSGSFGGGTSTVADVDAALKASTDAGVLFLFAAGNSGTEGVGYPGRSQYALAVAALDQAPLQRSSFSSTGPEVWVGAPGRSINSTYKDNTFALLSGTSMATPFVAALTAIAKSKWGPTKLKTEADLKTYLAKIASDLKPDGKDNQTGWGVNYVLAVLDTDPATVGGPVNPPPPPPPPTERQRPERLLSFVTPGGYSIVWNELTGAASAEPAVFSTQNGANAGFEVITIKALTVRVKTTTDAPVEGARTVTATADYFRNRGFMLPAPADFNDAAAWAPYFLEMNASLALKKKWTVTGVTVQDANGNVVDLSESQIRHWAGN
mgnify:CR=1 FL=1